MHRIAAFCGTVPPQPANICRLRDSNSRKNQFNSTGNSSDRVAVMTSGFSSALKLTDLNDYIQPSQACIKPVKIEKNDNAKVLRIDVEADGSYTEVNEDGSRSKLQATKISLTDCLACSGCVTTAETVLIEAQSIDELLSRMEDRQQWKVVVFSISPQTLASLGAQYQLSMPQCYRKLATFLTQTMKVNYVFDTSFSRDLALLEQAAEFVARYQQKQQQQAGDNEPNPTLPMLASSCPGWICYAEKTHGSYILPYISTTKSPQQIMGSLVKNFLPTVIANQSNSNNEHLASGNILHVTVMPCYDKKLEASREDFYNELLQSHDVDLVITTTEMEQLLQRFNIDFKTLPESQPPTIFNNLSDDGMLYGVPGGSGGYLEYILRFASKQIFNLDLPAQLSFKQVRNSDFKEVTAEMNGQVVLRFATAYGFRNIQNIVRAIKSNQCKYDFVEVMACPSGCLNGGGQLKAQPPMTVKQALQAVESTYESTQTIRLPEHNPAVKQIYQEWLGGSPMKSEHLHTKYHFVPKLEIKNPLAIQW